VKFTAAKKVAALLKLTPEDAFDFGDLIQSIKAPESEEKLQEEAKASAVEKKVKPEKIKEEKEAAPVVKVAEPVAEKIAARKISEISIFILNLKIIPYTDIVKQIQTDPYELIENSEEVKEFIKKLLNGTQIY
jgi:hypothetical protein